MVYVAAPVTSFQSKATVLPRANRASFAGLSKAGAARGEVVSVVAPPVTTFIELEITVFSCRAVSSTLVVLFGKPGKVETGKLTLSAPAGTVTDDGTVAEAGIRVNREMTTPPSGAGPGSVMVPVAVSPPFTVPGLTVYVDSVGGGAGVPGGLTVRSAETVTPPPLTKIVTTVGADTAEGIICTPARVLNAGTVVAVDRNGSTVGLLLLTFNVRSKEAADSTVTVPLGVPASPPTTTFGRMVNDTGIASDDEPDSRAACKLLLLSAVGWSAEHEAATRTAAISERRAPGLLTAFSDAGI